MALTKKQIGEYLNFLENEVVALLIHDKMFKETTAVIQANKKILKKNSFYDWMINAYVSDVIVRIRRLVDVRRDVRSLSRFLMEIKKDNTLRTKDAFVNRCKASSPGLPEIEELAEREFYEIAGAGAGEYSQALIQKDIDELKKSCAVIEDFSNSFITHSSQSVAGGTGKLVIPKFSDLNHAISLMEKLVIKYIFLYRGVGKTTLTPIWQYNWKSIFEIPWI